MSHGPQSSHPIKALPDSLVLKLPGMVVGRLESMRLKAGARIPEEVILYALAVYEKLQNIAMNDKIIVIDAQSGNHVPFILRPERTRVAVHGHDFEPDKEGIQGSSPDGSSVG